MLLGIASLITSCWFSSYYRKARDGLNFSSAIISFVGDVSMKYGKALPIFCGSLVFIHTCVMLGWGVYLINVLAEISTKYSVLLIVLIFLSFYWITKVFQTLIGFVVGGCFVWYFIRDEGEAFAPRERLRLYILCALTTSLGSLLKSGLLSGLCDNLLMIHLWTDVHVVPLSTGLSSDSSSEYAPPRAYPTSCKARLKRLVRWILSPLLPVLSRYHRLSIYMSAVYGQTLSLGGLAFYGHYYHTLELALHDLTRFNLTCIAVEVGGIMSLVFGLFSFTENNGVLAEGVFFAMIFYLAFSGISLCLESYKAAVDGLIVAFAINPERLSKENQFVFLRYLRESDYSLR